MYKSSGKQIDQLKKVKGSIMLSISTSTIGGFIGKNYKKLLGWGSAVAMLFVSGVAIFNAINILAAPGDSWSISVDGSGLLNVLTATNDDTLEEEVAYCLDPYTDFSSTYPEYMNAEASENVEVQALLKRTYPVLTARQMGIVYLNDASLTELEAYEATQIAIWKTVTNGEYEVNEALVGRQFELAKVVFESDIVIKDGPWLSVDMDGATRQNSSSTRDSYGPIKITVDTGSDRLDTAIKSENLTISPVASGRNWVISTSSSASGGNTSTLRVGTNYYVNYLKTQAGEISFSLSNALADSNYLAHLDEIISIYGVEANQVLGVVQEEPTSMSTTFEVTGGTTGVTLRKTWTCSDANECLTMYPDMVYFDLYKNTPDGYVKVDTASTIYISSMAPNTAHDIANNFALDAYAEYIVIERTEIQPVPGVGAVKPTVSSTFGSAGKYKINGSNLVTAGSNDAYYVGVRFMTGMNGSAETITSISRTVNWDITLNSTAYNYGSYGGDYRPEKNNFYIYSSTDNGLTWTLAEGPIEVYDYYYGDSTSYKFTMTPGTKYRLIQDNQLYYYYDDGECNDFVRHAVDTYVYGSNYSNFGSVRALVYDSQSPTATGAGSRTLSASFSGSSWSGRYTGIEWDAGWTDTSSSFTISNEFAHDEYHGDPEECVEQPSSWERYANVNVTNSGNNPDGWASSYRLFTEISHDGNSYSDESAVNPNNVQSFFGDDGEVYQSQQDFPTTYYTVYEDPMSFCAGKAGTPEISETTINGITKTVKSVTTSDTSFSVTGSGYSVQGYEYAPANCDTGEITGSWSTTRPSGTYAARVRVYVNYWTGYSNITIRANNSFNTNTVTTYSSDSSSNVAFILKYGWDGYNQVANYLDGTVFEIYDANDNYIEDWTMSAANRGTHGPIGGTSNYYVTPILPVGEYYLKEIEAVPGYQADKESKYYFTVDPVNNATALSITQVRKNGVATGTSNFDKAILNAPTYELAAFKFKRKVLESAIADSHIELYRKTDTDAEPAYGNENLRGYEKVAEFDSLVDGIVIEELVYGWYKLVEVTPPEGYWGPEPEVAVGFSTYIGPTTSPNNGYSGARVYIANDWIGEEEEPPVDPEVPEVPSTGVGRVGIDGGMVAATFIGMGCALVLGIAMFVGKKMAEEIEENGSIKLQR